jgi:hypothetical protein
MLPFPTFATSLQKNAQNLELNKAIAIKQAFEQKRVQQKTLEQKAVEKKLSEQKANTDKLLNANPVLYYLCH